MATGLSDDCRSDRIAMRCGCALCSGLSSSVDRLQPPVTITSDRERLRRRPLRALRGVHQSKLRRGFISIHSSLAPALPALRPRCSRAVRSRRRIAPVGSTSATRERRAPRPQSSRAHLAERARARAGRRRVFDSELDSTRRHRRVATRRAGIDALRRRQRLRDNASVSRSRRKTRSASPCEVVRCSLGGPADRRRP